MRTRITRCGPAAVIVTERLVPVLSGTLESDRDRRAAMQSNDIKDQDILGGTPVFRGTRVPFETLLDYLEGGQPLGEFLDDFPTVTEAEAIAALELAKSLLVGQLG